MGSRITRTGPAATRAHAPLGDQYLALAPAVPEIEGSGALAAFALRPEEEGVIAAEAARWLGG